MRDWREDTRSGCACKQLDGVTRITQSCSTFSPIPRQAHLKLAAVVGGGDTSGRVGSSCRERTRQGRSLTMGVVLQLKDISRDRKNIGNIF